MCIFAGISVHGTLKTVTAGYKYDLYSSLNTTPKLLEVRQGNGQQSIGPILLFVLAAAMSSAQDQRSIMWFISKILSLTVTLSWHHYACYKGRRTGYITLHQTPHRVLSLLL
jgi:hypothetical protein